ncbi:MAG: sialate O-acetylesterase [Bacteroidales bacterium]|nr:sialate O-acetylesterase [Bacteroidales bacterium]
MKKTLVFVLCLFAAIALRAEGLRLPDVMSSDMVLQQNTDANIWCWADAGAKVKVKVSWNKKSYSAQAGEDGFWKVAVATPAASFDPQTVTISSGKEKLVLENVLIGEVWLCSGQSNMEMPMGGWRFQPIENGGEDMRDARHYPGLRLVMIKKATSETVREEVAGQWWTTDSGHISEFSAIAYYFGRELTRELGVPVGLIVPCWGGTMIECWMDRETLIKGGIKGEDIDKDIRDNKDSSPWHTSTLMYNAMIYPLRHYTVNGFIWYQGCSNVGRIFVQDYAKLQAAMVTKWRELFGRGDLPFYYVQIAPHPYSANGDSGLAPVLRDRQRAAAALVPNSAMVGTCDLVYEFEEGIIHPRKKAEIGERLAYLALEKWYGFKNYGSDCPEFVKATFDAPNAIVYLKNCGGGLHSDMGWEFKGVTGFEVAGEDKVWYPATITGTDGTSIGCTAPEVPEPKYVRYLWHDFAIGHIWNSYRLPLLPFNSEL